MKRRLFFRTSPFNRLTYPLLLNILEKENFDIRLDIHILEDPPGDIQTRLTSDDALIYSFMTPHLPQIAGEVRKIRRGDFGSRHPLLIAGGPHVTGEQELAAAVGFDWICPGEGESILPELGKALLSPIPPGEKRIFRSQEAKDLSGALPISPRFASLPPLELTRGCFWNCGYCQTGSRLPKHRSEESIHAYLQEARRRKFKRISFISPSALEFGAEKAGKTDISKLSSLLELIHSYGFPFAEYGIFPSEIRPDTGSAEAFRLLKKSVRNRRVTIGAQSGMDAQLRRLSRGHTARQIEEAVALAAESGFDINLDFIFALPGETREEREEKIDFILGISKKYPVRAHLHHFFPLAGSRFAHSLPSFLHPEERQQLIDLRRFGIATDWWLEGEKRTVEFFQWLQREFSPFYDRYVSGSGMATVPV